MQPDFSFQFNEYFIRSRADKDGYTLLKDGIAIAGGSLTNCFSTLFDLEPESKKPVAELIKKLLNVV